MASSKLRQYFHTDYQPGERALVRKLDFFIFTFCCLSCFLNYLRELLPPNCALADSQSPAGQRY